MPKFLHKKKKKSAEKEKKATKSRSPLMADDSHSSKSSSASSRLKKDDGARDAEKKEREERRKARDKKFNDAKDASAKKKEKKKASKKPKLSREEQDAKDSKLGCWTKTQQVLVKIVHVIDALIGLTFVIYGSLISGFENPAMEAVITTLTFGSAMLFTSIMGIIGFYSGMCQRCGLVLSGYTAPFIAFTYLLLIVLLLASPGTVFDYLTTHKDVMHLNTAEILTLQQILPFFYIALASLAAIEIIRFMVLRNLRHTLVRYDAASQRILSSASSKKSSKSSRSKRSNRSDSDNLTEPLVGDEEEGKVDADDY